MSSERLKPWKQLSWRRSVARYFSVSSLRVAASPPVDAALLHPNSCLSFGLPRRRAMPVLCACNSHVPLL